jgi:hypothetical protein
VIVEWIVGLFTGIGSWVGSLFPDWTPPAFLTQLASQVNGLLANLNGVGVWVDWTYILVIVVAVLGTWVITLGVKTARALASYLPFFGGAG